MPLAHSKPCDDFRRFIQKVKTLDLGSLAYQLMNAPAGAQWDLAQTTKAITRYLAFLYLVDRHPNLTLVPTPEIDRVWHCHILDTEKYAIDCHILFGQFIHHFPYFGLRSEADRLAQQQAIRLTRSLFKQHFGQMLPNAEPDWGADCEPILAAETTGCASLTDRDRPQVVLPGSLAFCADRISLFDIF